MSLPTIYEGKSKSLESIPGLGYRFTERNGGVSAPPFASLNLGLHVGDDPEAVRENRLRAAEALGFSLSQMVCGEQVHGGNVAVVTRQDAGRGATDFASALPGVDALVTETPGVLLALFFADCVPVLLADPVRRVVAFAHAGWRGLVTGVIANTVTTMGTHFGCNPSDLIAAIGPCIGPEMFEVGQEVAVHFPNETIAPAHPEGKPHIDLPSATLRLLLEAGVPPGQVTISGFCTYSDSTRWFSHRRDAGRTGRMGAFIGLRDSFSPS